VQGDPQFTVDSERPAPLAATTPWWMRVIFGPVAADLRIPVAFIVILLLVFGGLSAFNVPQANQVWDLIKSMISGGIGGGIVAAAANSLCPSLTT
jgi:hypothetical protein